MLCRVLLAVIAISYLICVLFLSGLQKEDLEVSLLKKMQRYNIDLNDFNDKKFREGCIKDTISRRSNPKDENQEKINTEVEYTTTTEYPTTVSVTPTLDISELQRVLTYFKHKKKIRTPPATESNKNNVSENINMGAALLAKLMQERDSDQTTQSSQDTVSANYDNKEEPNMEHVNKSWKSFDESEIQNVHNTQNETSAPRVSLKKDNIPQNTTKELGESNLKDIEQIGKILAKYIPFLTSSKDIKNISEPINIDANEINKKLATSIAAINALNENIVNLQKNINVAQLLSSNVSTLSAESMPDRKMHFATISLKQQSYEKELKVPANHPLVQSINQNDQINFNPNLGMTSGMVITQQTIRRPENYGQSVVYGTNTFNNGNYQKAKSDDNNHQILEYNAIVYKNKLKQQVAEIRRQAPNCSCETQSENCDGTPTDSETDLQVKGIPNVKNTLKNKHVPYYYPNKNLNSNKKNRDDLLNNKHIQHTPETENPQIKNSHSKESPKGLGAALLNLQEHNIPSYTPQIEYSLDQSPITNTLPIFQENDNQSGIGSPLQKLQKFKNQPEIDQNINAIKNVTSFEDVSKNKQITTTPANENEQNPYVHEQGLGAPMLNLKDKPFSSNLTENKSDNETKTKQELINSFSNDIIISKFFEMINDLKKQTVTNSTKNYNTVTTSPSTIVLNSSTAITFSTPNIYTTATPTSSSASSTSTSRQDTPKTALVSEVADLVTALNNNNTTVAEKPVETKAQLASQAIKKLSQLLEHYKAGNDTTSKPRERKVKFSGNGPKKKLLINRLPPPPPPPLMFPPQMLPAPPPAPINFYGIRVPPKQAPPIFFQHFIPPLMQHPPFPPSYISSVDNRNSMAPILQVKAKTQRFPNAIMIQTNTDEIQPLGIPMVKPEAMNLNIILTTQNPYWTKNERNRWNFMYKYGRSPDKIVDINNTKHSLNAYSNIQDKKYAKIDYTNSNKNINATNYDKLRSNIFKKKNFFNKTDERKIIIPEVNDQNTKSQLNEHETKYQSHNLPLNYNIKNVLNLKVSNNSNKNAHTKRITEIGKNNEELLSRLSKTSLKDSSVNTYYTKFQNDRIPRVHKYPYRLPFVYDVDVNAGLPRPNSYKYRNYETSMQTSHKQEAKDGLNRLSPYIEKPETYPKKPSPYLKLEDNLHENVYISNPNIMPVKDITVYSAQLNSQPLGSRPHNRFKSIDLERQYLKNHKYLHRQPAETQHNQPTDRQSTDESKTKVSLKNLERYLDSLDSPVDSVKILEALGNINGRELEKSTYKSLKHDNDDYSDVIAIMKTRVNNSDKQISSPSDEESNSEFKPQKPILRPFYENSNRYRYRINTEKEKVYPRLDYEKPADDNRSQPHIDLISAMLGHRNERERKYSMDMQSQEYRQELGAAEGTYSDNVRGFHEKLEGSDWPDSPAECGHDERCTSSVKVLARHQEPLDGKRPSKYDDTRFQNFLKTQQKVNKMLELILSTKSGVSDVETM